MAQKLVNPPRVPVVMVFLTMAYGYYRDVLSGVSKYAGQQWRLITHDAIVPGALTALQTHAVTGVIAAVSGRNAEAELLATGVPCVNVSGRLESPRLPTVRTDDDQVGRLAAEHLLARGHRHFACTSGDGPAFCMRREQAFAATLEARGLNVLKLPAAVFSTPEGVSSLPRPLAIFITNDRHASQFISTCHQIGAHVPGDFAVIGVDNDLAYCTSSTPALTSVDPAGDVVGFQAARLLDGLMAHRSPMEDNVLIVPPRQVVVRASTDMLNIGDEDMSRVIRFIHEHACQGIAVKAVAREFLQSRRTLERRFLKEFGHSVLDEIHRIQFQHARELLTTTDLKIPAIAQRCGFSNFRNFITRFKQRTGLPPGEFRKQQRLR